MKKHAHKHNLIYISAPRELAYHNSTQKATLLRRYFFRQANTNWGERANTASGTEKAGEFLIPPAAPSSNVIKAFHSLCCLFFNFS